MNSSINKSLIPPRDLRGGIVLLKKLDDHCDKTTAVERWSWEVSRSRKIQFMSELMTGFDDRSLGLKGITQWRSRTFGRSGGGQMCRPFVLGFGNWRAC